MQVNNKSRTKDAAARRQFLLVICDGLGEKSGDFGNAVSSANTPNLDKLKQEWPNTIVEASGQAVGVPDGELGNSEIGHLTIGSGRIIFQPLSRQHHEINSGIFYENEVLIAAIELAKQRGKAVHVVGMVSPGGVHSHSSAALAIVKLAAKLGQTNVHVHAFTDGRDTHPRLALSHIEEFEAELAKIGTGKLSSMVGRYYAMDRDNRWERTQLAYDLLVGDNHAVHHDAKDYISKSYERGEDDEFLRPIAIAGRPEDRTRIEDGDVVVFFNFRPDRVRQLSHALVDKEFDKFERSRVLKDLHFISFTAYDEELQVPVVFGKQPVDNCLAEIVSEHGLRQFHIAETEKYAHVTYFLNGGREEAFKGEDREMVPSPKVATYEAAPAMSAKEITDVVLDVVKSEKYDLIALNYANADMLGHTGDFKAAKESIEVLDDCLGKVVKAMLDKGGVVLITADHGNAEYMIDPDTKDALTAHTTNPVPVILCGTPSKSLRSGGGLSDIAPTVLEIMNLPIPDEMTGKSLIQD